MKYKEIKNKSKIELEKILKENRDKVRDLRFKVANRSLKNIREIRNSKKLIAQALTALNQGNKKSKEQENKTEEKK